jgi:hypothetical protein
MFGEYHLSKNPEDRGVQQVVSRHEDRGPKAYRKRKGST